MSYLRYEKLPVMHGVFAMMLINQTAFWLFRSGKVYLILSSEALIYQI